MPTVPVVCAAVAAVYGVAEISLPPCVHHSGNLQGRRGVVDERHLPLRCRPRGRVPCGTVRWQATTAVDESHQFSYTARVCLSMPVRTR